MWRETPLERGHAFRRYQQTRSHREGDRGLARAPVPLAQHDLLSREFDHGASVHEHAHAQEEVWVILAGELEVTIDGVTQIAVPGVVAIVPPNVVHSVKALRAGKAIVVDYPLRPNI